MDAWVDGWIDGEVDDSLPGYSRTSESSPEGHRVEVQQLSSSWAPPIRTRGTVFPVPPLIPSPKKGAVAGEGS